MTIFSKIARVAAPLAFAALFGLAACSKDPAPEEPENYSENQSVEEDIPAEAAPQAPEIINAAPPANVAVAEPVDTTTQEQQMQEDADASGMTAHVQAPEEGIVVADGEKK